MNVMAVVVSSVSMILASCVASTADTRVAPLNDFSVTSDRYVLTGNTLLSEDSKIRINIPADWLPRVSEFKNDYVPAADFDPDVITFAVTNEVLGAYVSSYGIQQEGSARAAWGRDVMLVIDTKSSSLIGRLPDLGITKARTNYVGCVHAYNDILLLGDINFDGATDVAVIREELHCDDRYDAANERDSVVASHRWGTMKWYIFDGTDWRYSAKHDDQCTAEKLRRLQWPALAKGPVDYGLEIMYRRTSRTAIPAHISSCLG